MVWAETIPPKPWQLKRFDLIFEVSIIINIITYILFTMEEDFFSKMIAIEVE